MVSQLPANLELPLRLLILGAAGPCCKPATMDLLRRGGFARITLAARQGGPLHALREAWAKPGDQVDVVVIDASDAAAIDRLVGAHDIVCNGLPYPLSGPVVAACAKYRVPGIELDVIDDGDALAAEVERADVAYVASCGATPGTTNMLARAACDRLDVVDEVHVSFAAFRPLGFSRSTANVALWDFDPANRQLRFWRDGAYHSAAPFSSERVVDFPAPIGRQSVFSVAHEETQFLPSSLGAREVHARGCFPPDVMQMLRGLVGLGLITRELVHVQGQTMPFWDLLCDTLPQLPGSRSTPIWSYGLHVEVTGMRAGQKHRLRAYTLPPSTDTWPIPQVYSNHIGLPMAVGVELLAARKFHGAGLKGPESFFRAADFLSGLAARGIHSVLEEDGQQVSVYSA